MMLMVVQRWSVYSAVSLVIAAAAAPPSLKIYWPFSYLNFHPISPSGPYFRRANSFLQLKKLCVWACVYDHEHPHIEAIYGRRHTERMFVHVRVLLVLQYNVIASTIIWSKISYYDIGFLWDFPWDTFSSHELALRLVTARAYDSVSCVQILTCRAW